MTDGSQGPDISTIPTIALRQVEVLRDGASAQYGSDAIAGVLNFLLKDNASGGSFEFNRGTYRAGDGDAYTVAGNVGLPLGASGFANLSLEYGNADPTNRSVQRADAAALIAAGNTDVADPAQIWGNPTIEDDLKLFGNFGNVFANGLQFYAHTNYASKRVTEGFYFRNPNNRANIYSLDEGETLLIGDLLAARGMGSANCPVVRVTDNLPDPVALAQVVADPNCFSFREIAPGGFTPQFGGVVTDMSAVAGLRQIAESGLTWDASASYGAHESDFFFNNTVNASLGLDTPRNFDPGLYRQEEVNLNFDVSYAASDRVNFAAGAEWRDEKFTIGAGGRPSWEVGPFAAQGFVSGSNGFPGFPDYTAGTWNRSNVAVYGDLEMRGRDDRWSFGGALRFEHFDVFGATTNGKLSARVALSPVVALRGGVSTGFRAPTPGQQHTLNVQTTIDPETLQLVDSANVPSTFRAAELRGGVPLEPETSFNTTAGIVVDNGPFTLTADYFRVDVFDRLALSQTFTLTGDERALLLSEGITSAGTLAFFRFFINDFETRTQGIDIVSTYAPPNLGGDTVLSFTMNYTDTKVTKESDLLGPGEVLGLQRGVPRTRWNAAVNQRLGRVGLLARVSYFGAWVDHFDARFVRGPDSAASRRPADRRPGAQPAARQRRDAGGRGPERRQHLLGPDGPVRRGLRSPLQPVHSVGPERRILLRAPQLRVGPLSALKSPISRSVVAPTGMQGPRWVRPALRALVLFAIATAASAPGAARTQDGALSGTVTDATGLVLPGVTVEARSTTDGGSVRVASTDAAGRFAIAALPPGAYDVTFTLSGFGAEVRRGVAIRAGAAVTLEVGLAVQLEERVVVVGSRAQPRSVTESPVPIDAIPFQDVASQGATTLDYQLRTLVPSFNVATHPISGAASLVRPASLRNLAHDHTLVLVNGKRRHRSAILVWFGGVTDGTQGPDISTIPSIALRQVEVLRDGASAQYGSDAIAGVLNFLLRDSRAGGSVEFDTGTYRAGDGDAYRVAGNVGFPLGANGFANLSLEYGNAGPTDRSVQRADAAALIAAGNSAVADPAQPWGNTTSEDDLKLFGNFGHLYSNGLQLYGHANYAGRTSVQSFYYRNPNTRANIFSLDGGGTLLVGDVLDARDGIRDGSAGCPTVRITANQPDQAALGQVFGDPNCFSFQEIAPGGFTPSFSGVITDLSAVAGVRRAAANGLVWDASASYGAHEADFFLFNTVNASLGPSTPRSFDPGLYRQAEANLNLDVSYAATDVVHLAGGAEWRDERFTIRAGERPSWEVGPYAAQGFRLRLQWFPGISRLHGRDLDPGQCRPLRRCGAARTGWPLDARRSPAGRTFRRVRRDDKRQAVRPLRAGRRRLGAGWRQHRIPCPDARPAEHLQRAVDHQPRDPGSGRQRHRAVHLQSFAVPGRPAARPRNVDQRDGRSRDRHRTVHADR